MAGGRRRGEVELSRSGEWEMDPVGFAQGVGFRAEPRIDSELGWARKVVRTSVRLVVYSQLSYRSVVAPSLSYSCD